MNYPYTRHFQRYEYVVKRGWVDGKNVVDIGCGNAIGSHILSHGARHVYACDPCLEGIVGTPFVFLITPGLPNQGNVTFAPLEFELLDKTDVAVAIEVFEHFANPRASIHEIAKRCDHAFLTTPLALVTSKTTNSTHTAEYSAEDFDNYVSESFEILEKKYQTADMQILDKAEPNGDSCNNGHVVQMIWGRSTYGQE